MRKRIEVVCMNENRARTDFRMSTPSAKIVPSSIVMKKNIRYIGDLFFHRFDENRMHNDWSLFAQDPDVQSQSRRMILCLADFIIPGHGKTFPVTSDLKAAYAC